MNIAVLQFPASNCDQDALHVVQNVLGLSGRFVWHKENSLAGFDAVIVPGGFSYGDYLRTGAIARFSPIMGAVRDFAARGGPVLGICNGFQILCEAGLLPGVLMRNAGRRFVCRMQHLRVENDSTPFTRGYARGQVVKFAIAHGEGNYTIDPSGLAELERSGRVAFRYCDAAGVVGAGGNPNGSTNDIAGVYNDAFNVLGLMPHPENLIDALVGGVDGRGMFAALAAAAR